MTNIQSLSEESYRKYTMNSPKDTFKNVASILSLVWSVGKLQDWLKQ